MATPVPPRAGMTLSFADEFERTSLNGEGSPGWLTTYFWGARRLGEFNQQQIFVDANYGPGGIDPFVFDNGTVNITADRTPDQYLEGYGYPYTSGHMNTYDTFNFRYGYIEMRAKTAGGQGFLETFYASRTDRSVLGEIDVLEFIGNQPKSLYGTVHYEEPDGTLTKAKVVRAGLSVDMTADYHTYGVDWTPSYIRFYFDGKLMGEMQTPGSLKAAVYLMADFSVGGTWVGYPDATTPFPSAYSIDYIRVWQEAYAFVPENVVGTGGAETLAGGDGADTVTAGAGNDTVLAGGGNDIVRGGAGDDRLQGQSGSDTLVGESGVDWLQGGPDDDFYVIFDGQDSITDGKLAGFDTVMMNLPSFKVPNNIEAVIHAGTGPTSVLGQWAANFFVGGNAGDTLNGMEGNDTLIGGAGADSLIGSAGNDFIDTRGGGNDTVNSGSGRDVIAFGPSSTASTITVLDFASGLDRLDLRRLGIDTPAELAPFMTTNAEGKAVIFKDNTRILMNVGPAQIKAGDFVTGALPTKTAPVESVISNDVLLASSPIGSAVAMFVPKGVPEPLNYTLLSGGGGDLAVRGRQLVVTGALDPGASYTLTVRATNEFGLTRDQTFTVAALGNSAPGALSFSGAKITDAAPAGTTVGSLSATDPDPGDRLAYSLTGDAGGRFAVEGNLVKTATTLDPVPYTITVKVTDLGGLSTEKSFTINVASGAVLDGVTIVGSAGGDFISPTSTIAGQPTATARGDSILGNGGNDTLDGGAGTDRIDGGAGSDRLIGGAGADSLIGGAGVDYASYTGASAAIAIDMADSRWLSAAGDAAGDLLSQIEGVEGSNFNDTILGTAAGDRLYGRSGNDSIEGRAGNDFLFGELGDDTLIGGTGNDVMSGAGGYDEFVFALGTGRDVINGFAAGSGTGDVIVYRGTFSSFAEVLAAAEYRSGVVSPQGTAFSGVVITRGTDEQWLTGLTLDKLAANDFRFETDTAPPPPPPPAGVSVTGTAGADVITPTQTVAGQPTVGGGNDTVNAQAGNDYLDGAGGNDRLNGFDGNDTFVGGPGADVLDGGNGFDFVTYAASTSGVALDMIAPNWTGAKGDAAGETYFMIEALDGSTHDDLIIGTNEPARLGGLAGDDTIQGRVGNDTILGGDGADSIIGGAGNDSLSGGAGNDVFVFAAGHGRDVIVDFAAGGTGGDLVRFQGSYTSFTAAMAAASDYTGTSPLGAAFSGVVIGTGADQVWLQGVTKSALDAGDFAFA